MPRKRRRAKPHRTAETTGLLLRLPVPLGTTVWRVQNNPACHEYVQNAETFLYGRVVSPRLIVKPVPFALAMLEDWGKTVFATETEGLEKVRETV